MSNRTKRLAEAGRRAHLNAVRHAQERAETRRRLLLRLGWTAVGVIVVVAVAIMLLTSRATSSSAVRPAPDFTLSTTAGTSVHLADYRGKNVLLYFSEGAGCQSCLLQMGEIEKRRADFDAAGVTVLPIVMNSKDDILTDLRAGGVTTPFLLDDGTVSRAYGTLGKGMHAGLPGHSFVLIDAGGVQRWYGEYPSMWLAPSDLLLQIRSRLPA